MKTNFKTIPVRVPAELHSWLRHYSVDEGASINSLVVELLSAWRDDLPFATRQKYGAMPTRLRPR